jgi:hypothetical protein
MLFCRRVQAVSYHQAFPVVLHVLKLFSLMLLLVFTFYVFPLVFLNITP